MQNQLQPRKAFNYNALNDNATRATLRTEATAIKAAVKRTHDNIVEIGTRLIHAKELLQHGDFQQWIEGEFGMGYDMAWNFMNASKRFSKIDFNQLLGLPQTAIFALARPSVDDETRVVALEMAASGELKTTADAKALIEAAKPVSAQKELEQYDASRAARDAEEAAIRAAPDEDFDDSDPFLDSAQLQAAAESSPYFEEELEEIEPEAPAPEMTLKQRVKNAEVIHDTLDSTPKPETLSDEDWLETLPIYRVLKQKQHRAIFVKRDLLSMRALHDALGTFEHHARRAFDFKNPGGTPAETRIISAAAMPRPLDWQVCAPCKGNGCNRCAHSGYDVTGAGISPLRVESGEVTL